MQVTSKHGLQEHPLFVFYQALRIDPLLFTALLVLCLGGLIVLYSATGGETAALARQAARLAIGFAGLFIFAQISVDQLRAWSPWIYAFGVALLVAVMLVGVVGKGAQRWLDLGFIRFQPSELMKIWLPMMMAWFYASRPIPPSTLNIFVGFLIIALPAVLIIQQPDLGTAILVTASGLFVIFLAGIRYRLLTVFGVVLLAAAPAAWIYLLRDYQRQRILTLLDPESDPLGTGYHIIQSKIAIGSGGVYGKGWLNGTQSQLDFIPERSTDFIFAVIGEEFGFLGAFFLLALYLFIVIRGLMIAARAQDTYSRLLAGSISLSFFSYVFVNIGMVAGLLPVVGVPLPLISYGGTSVVTLLIMFGILMSIQSRRKLLSH